MVQTVSNGHASKQVQPALLHSESEKKLGGGGGGLGGDGGGGGGLGGGLGGGGGDQGIHSCTPHNDHTQLAG